MTNLPPAPAYDGDPLLWPVASDWDTVAKMLLEDATPAARRKALAEHARAVEAGACYAAAYLATHPNAGPALDALLADLQDLPPQTRAKGDELRRRVRG